MSLPIHFEVSGSGDIPLVCVHGWGCRGDQFNELSQRLYKDFRIFRVDLPGHGRTFADVETSYGKVRMKVSGEGAYAPEYEDCRRIAQDSGVPLKQVIAEANFAYLKNSR